jgi:NAD-dependent DNA ligase
MKEAREKIKTKGGILREDITNDVWYFVTNNPKNNSQTFEKARKLGVLFIDEQEFIKMIE